MKRILLTGAAGFIGSHLVPQLLAAGKEVVAFDNLSTGRESDLDPCRRHPNFYFVFGDLRQADQVEAAIKGCDTVWHLGANTLIPPGSSNLRLDFDSNVIGTLNVLEAMREQGVPNLLFASTAAVYGDAPGHSFDENFGPLHPISLYGASKLACEALIAAHAHLAGIHTSIFRFSNVVGGGMGHGVTYDFIQKLKKMPNALHIWGDGQGRKPYFTVEDCIRGMFMAHEIPLHSRGPIETFNLGTETSTTVDRVGEIVCEEMGLSNVQFIHGGGRHGFPGDVPFVSYNTAKMRRHGWAATLTSDEAVRSAARRMLDGKT